MLSENSDEKFLLVATGVVSAVQETLSAEFGDGVEVHLNAQLGPHKSLSLSTGGYSIGRAASDLLKVTMRNGDSAEEVPFAEYMYNCGSLSNVLPWSSLDDEQKENFTELAGELEREAVRRFVTSRRRDESDEELVDAFKQRPEPCDDCPQSGSEADACAAECEVSEESKQAMQQIAVAESSPQMSALRQLKRSVERLIESLQ
jgi:hypothetical protein